MCSWRRGIPICVLTGFCWLAPQAPAQEELPPLPEVQQRAVAAITALEGTVSWDDKLPGHPVTAISLTVRADEDVELVRVFPLLKTLDLTGISDPGLAKLVGLDRLRRLGIYDAKVTDAGLARLLALPRLEELELAGVAITDAGLAHLKELPRLNFLRLEHVSVSEAGLLQLKEAPRLRRLYLGPALVSDAGLARLKKAMPYTLVSGSTPSGHLSWWGPRENNPPGEWEVVLRLAVALLAALGVVAVLFWLAQVWPLWALKLVVVGGLILAVGLSLLRLAPVMFPVQAGNPAGFWLHAVRVDSGVKDPRIGHGYFHYQAGWYYYDDRREGFFRVRAAEVEASFPDVLNTLQNAPEGKLDPDVEAGLREWQRNDAGRTDVVGLIHTLQKTRHARLQQEDPDWDSMIRMSQQWMSEQGNRSQHYHFNLLFEFVFLTALILIAAWPWLSGAGPLRWAVHLGLLPLLFYLPHWLGYAQFALLCCVGGPEGGVLYGWLLVRSYPGEHWTDLDNMLVQALPQILEPLSLTQGNRFELKVHGGVGPVVIARIAFWVGMFTLAIGAWIQPVWRKRVRRCCAAGSDVLAWCVWQVEGMGRRRRARPK